MIEIYLVTSVAPVPMAAMMGKEWGGMGTKSHIPIRHLNIGICSILRNEMDSGKILPR